MEINNDFLMIKMLADQGNVDAILALGIAYEHGLYTEKMKKLHSIM